MTCVNGVMPTHLSALIAPLPLAALVLAACQGDAPGTPGSGSATSEIKSPRGKEPIVRPSGGLRDDIGIKATEPAYSEAELCALLTFGEVEQALGYKNIQHVEPFGSGCGWGPPKGAAVLVLSNHDPKPLVRVSGCSNERDGDIVWRVCAGKTVAAYVGHAGRVVQIAGPIGAPVRRDRFQKIVALLRD